MLRIGDGGFTRAPSEEAGVEQVDVGERGADLDVGRIGDQGRGLTGRAQLVIREASYGLDARAKILPELRDVTRAGEPASHADDRNLRSVFLPLRVFRHEVWDQVFPVRGRTRRRCRASRRACPRS